MRTTSTGIPIRACSTCDHTHPVTRTHCAGCGLATLFGHADCVPAARTTEKVQS